MKTYEASAKTREEAIDAGLEALGVSISDLDLLTIGLVLDMWTEKANDGIQYAKVATQEDFDKF